MKKVLLCASVFVCVAFLLAANSYAKPLDKASPLSQGVKALKKGNFQEAITIFQESISKDPNNAVAYYNLGVAYIRTNEMEAAKDNIKKANQLFKDQDNNNGVKATQALLQQLGIE